MGHCRGSSAFRCAEFERDDGLARGARRLAGFTEGLGVAHALEIDHDDADAGIRGKVGHEIGGLKSGLVSRRDHVADANTAILERLTKRHHDRAGLSGDRDGASLHRHDAIVDVREQLFAGAEIAEAIGTGNGEAGFLDRLLQFDREPLAFGVLQFAEARCHDRGRAGPRRCRVPHDLHREPRRHQHQHVIRLVGQAGKVLVAGHAPDRFTLGVDRIQAAFEAVLDQVVPDPLRVVTRLVRCADQHDVARMKHRMDAFDGIACLCWR